MHHQLTPGRTVPQSPHLAPVDFFLRKWQLSLPPAMVQHEHNPTSNETAIMPHTGGLHGLRFVRQSAVAMPPGVLNADVFDH